MILLLRLNRADAMLLKVREFINIKILKSNYNQVSQWLRIPNDNVLQKNLFTS